VKLATWNVNSIRARKDRVGAWLDRHRPDVLCMQETKVEDDGFPAEVFTAAGYELALHGQKSYNGVAIASRLPMTEVTRGLDDGTDDDQSRLIAATIGGVRVISAYFPNGEAVTSPKYAYKLAWIARLRGWLDRRGDTAAKLALCGDFNVMPEDRDCWNPTAWAGKALFSEPERAALREIAAWGLHDAFRKHHAETGLYSYFDYMGVALFKNQGLRIDHVYVTKALYDACTSCEIDREARKGQNASDHAPVIATFEQG
jgi:exodeoxyribonuclease-3